MRYRFVIEWIDAELGRLQAARKLLAVSPSAEVERAVKDVERASKARPATDKRRGRPPGTTVKSKASKSKAGSASPETRALTANYPLHPVVVSPAQMQPEKPAATPGGETTHLQPGADGTLESMVREAEARQTVS